MTTLITGNFRHLPAAQQALSDLVGAGFTAEQTTLFAVTSASLQVPPAPGSSSESSLKVDHAAGGSASAAAVGGAVGIAIGAAVGVTTLPLLGPGAAVAAAGVGAYVGSLYGALGNMDDKRDTAAPTPNEEEAKNPMQREPGTLVAVVATTSAQQNSAISALRANGATDVERAQGNIVSGHWIDFDPRAPLAPLTE